MKIRLNGADVDVDAGTTLASLLRRHDISQDATGVAVAMNDVVVPKRDWATRRLEDGDTVEVIHAVQGG
jgi:sulfur carrier protein